MSRPLPPSRADFHRWQRITLRWADNDAYGHVNNTIYYQWFDSAVNAWLVDQELLDIGAGDPIALVVETRCAYFAALSFPGDVEVGLRVRHVGSRFGVAHCVGHQGRVGTEGRLSGARSPASRSK